MKGLVDSMIEKQEPLGWTPEAVLELGKLTWFEMMMKQIPEEHFFSIQRAMGKAELIRDQLTSRFGALPPEIQARIDHADVEALGRWGKRLLMATTLDDVFTSDPPIVTH